MKEKIALLIFIFSIQFINTQLKENNKVDITSELSLGNYSGVDLNLNFVTKKNYTLKVGYSGNLRYTKSVTKDYASLNDVFPFTGPYDYFKSY